MLCLTTGEATASVAGGLAELVTTCPITASTETTQASLSGRQGLMIRLVTLSSQCQMALDALVSPGPRPCHYSWLTLAKVILELMNHKGTANHGVDTRQRDLQEELGQSMREIHSMKQSLLVVALLFPSLG